MYLYAYFQNLSFISKFHWNKAIMVSADISKLRLTAAHSVSSSLFVEERPAYILPVVRNTMLFQSKFTIIRVELVFPNPNLTEPYSRSEA